MNKVISGADNIGTTPVNALANAIIVQAANDYRVAKRALKNNPNNVGMQYHVEEIKNFFLGDWIKQLTKLNPEFILHQLDAEFA